MQTRTAASVPRSRPASAPVDGIHHHSGGQAPADAGTLPGGRVVTSRCGSERALGIRLLHSAASQAALTGAMAAFGAAMLPRGGWRAGHGYSLNGAQIMRPVIMLVLAHYDDESIAYKAIVDAMARGALLHVVYVSEAEGGKRVRAVKTWSGHARPVLDHGTGKPHEDEVPIEERAKLSCEREWESLRFWALMGAGPQTTITTLQGNPDIDPYNLPIHQRDTSYLLGDESEEGQWQTEATVNQLVEAMHLADPVAVWTLSNDCQVHQAHRATHELSRLAIHRYAEAKSVAPIGLFGAKEIAWYSPQLLSPVNEERSILLKFTRRELMEKKRAVQTAFVTQWPGHPDYIGQPNGLAKHEVLEASDHTTADQVTAMRNFLLGPVHPLAVARQAATRQLVRMLITSPPLPTLITGPRPDESLRGFLRGLPLRIAPAERTPGASLLPKSVRVPL